MNAALFQLDGRRALVTGAGRGIGAGVARVLAEAGAAVTLVARSVEEIEALAETLREEGRDAQAAALDVTDIAAFESFVTDRPAPHMFVNNAGTNRPKPLSEVTPEDYDAVMDLNLRATIFAARAVSMRMAMQGVKGSIINMSSQMGHVGAPNRTLYCASKWAVEGFTRALSMECAKDGIRVNTVCPTFVDTPMTRPFLDDPTFQSEVLDRIRLGRLATVEDVAAAVLFLASDAAGMITGSALKVDGGWTAG